MLVCEDDDDIRAVVGRALTESGYDAVVVPGPEAALQLLRGPRRVDLLLSDLVMPGMSGRELADRAVELRPQLAVLFMSGYAAGVLGAEVEAGPALLQKPFGRAALLTAIDQALPDR